MAIAFLDHLDPDESRGLARFLVEMIALEQVVDRILTTHYAAPESAAAFERDFLNTMTLGNKVQRLRGVLAGAEGADELMRQVRDLIEVRNTVAHRLPELDYEPEPDTDDIDAFRVYRTGTRLIEARALGDWADIAAHTSMAIRVLQISE